MLNKKVLMLIICAFILFLANSVNAVSFYNPSSTLGLGSADLQEKDVSVSQLALGVLGLLAVLIILYAGFIFMTGGGGNEDRVEQAKKTLVSAIIGLILVLLVEAHLVWGMPLFISVARVISLIHFM